MTLRRVVGLGFCLHPHSRTDSDKTPGSYGYSGVVALPVLLLGKWLYGATLNTLDKASANYKSVQALHADFHKSAARVAELALSGKKTDAEKMMNLNGEFSVVSGKLISALMEWKKLAK